MNTEKPPEKVRAFVAIYPDAEVICRLEAAQKQLSIHIAADAVKWTKPEQIHLTLQFLGHVRRDLLGGFANALKQVASDRKCFRLRADSVGCFPSDKHPKIIWAGLAGELEPLRVLKEELDAAFSVLGYVPEKRKFHAHLTLGRVGRLNGSDARKLAREISHFQSRNFGEWEARGIQLMQSVLSREGARHSPLNSVALKKV